MPWHVKLLDDNETRSINRQRNRLMCFLRAPKAAENDSSSAVSKECGEENLRNGSDKISTSSQKKELKLMRFNQNLHKLPEAPSSDCASGLTWTPRTERSSSAAGLGWRWRSRRRSKNWWQNCRFSWEGPCLHWLQSFRVTEHRFFNTLRTWQSVNCDWVSKLSGLRVNQNQNRRKIEAMTSRSLQTVGTERGEERRRDEGQATFEGMQLSKQQTK